MTDEAPKIQIDTDWKAQAQAEKERLAQKEQEKEAERSPEGRELPEADFRTLVGTLASQAIMGLGMRDPQSGKVMVDLEGAKFSIDLLGVLEEKTKGNINDEEIEELTQVLVELRNRFVQITQMIAQQAGAEGAIPGTPGTPGIPEIPGSPLDAGPEGAGSKIIQP
ncbi:MAG: DUF1844 domain-containing protein [Planctomycetota bacterium]|nr:DUF1844 domain-containing protein [Planctomycetota bacterium]